MKHDNRAILVLAATLAAFGAGCQSPTTYGMSSSAAVSGDRIVNASLKVDDPGLARHVSLSDVVTAVTADGFLRVQCRLVSTDRREFRIQYKFRFFDSRGIEPAGIGERPWIPVSIHGGEDVPLNAVSPVPDASGFVVEIRRI